MNNYHTNIHQKPHLKFLYFYFYRTLLILTFLAFTHYPIVSFISNHCINNDQHNNLCHEVWNLDLIGIYQVKNPLFEVWIMY